MGKIIAAIVGALVLVILIVLAILIWFPTEWLQRMSYLAIVVTSFFACGLLIISTGIVVAVLALISVITTLIDKKVGPLVDKVNETADSAKGTVAYVGEGVVSPLIKIASILAGIQAAIRALFRGRR